MSDSVSSVASVASSAQITVTLPDGATRNYDAGVTIADVAHSIGERLGRDTIGGILNGAGKVVDRHTPLSTDVALQIITVKTDAGLEVLRHSCSHLLASAVQSLFPGTQVTFGPAVENGFYYDFFREEGPFTPDDFAAIETKMTALARGKIPFERSTVSRDEARKFFTEKGERFKAEHVDVIPEGATISLYKHGDWTDLCEGPHIPTTKYLKHFKLTHVAGAYWRGDESQPMLSRIYGTVFWSKEGLAEHLSQIEEAKKRDHRRLGIDLDLFSFNEIAPAMPFFHPKGALIYNLLTEFIRHYYTAIGFDEVITPQIVDSQLYHRSGHYANYKDNIFFSQIDEREYGVKPMNCPGHALIYAAGKRSYRDLPIRYADFGRLHRYERSGVTAGLTRVRSFAQDDAHIFCTEAQIGDEIATQIEMIKDIYGHFNFDMRVAFSTKPKKAIGNEEDLSDDERKIWSDIWEKAEGKLEEVLKTCALEYTIKAGDGAFYGPKIDFEVRDAIGRWFQLGTIQLDFSMPRKFSLSYTSADNAESRPVMIHRAVLGSLERFMGILMEHCAGDFPVWLAPKQLRVLTINDTLLPHGESIACQAQAQGIRVSLDRRSEGLGYKIRDAELQKVPFLFVVGKKEQEAGTVSVRRRKGEDYGEMPLDQALSLVLGAAAMPAPGDALIARVGVSKFGL